MEEGKQLYTERKRGKRKRSFLKVSKIQAKRGRYGLGTQIEPDVFEYYCRMIEIHKIGFSSPEEKVSFGNNALEQAEGKIVPFSCNQVVSRAFEVIIQCADIYHVLMVEKSFLQDLRLVFVDRFASHVTQLLIRLSCERVIKSEEKIAESFMYKSCKFAVNNIEEFVYHNYGNHVVRTCLDSLKEVGDSADMPENLPLQFYNSLIEMPLYQDVCHFELGSCLLQHLLNCLKVTSPKLCHKTIINLLNNIFAPDSTATDDRESKNNDKFGDNFHIDVFNSTPLLRLLEAAIECASGKYFTQIYAKLFINNFKTLCQHDRGHFAVQKLISSATDISEFESIFDEVTKCHEELLSCERFGMIVALSKACQVIGKKQGDFIKFLMKILNCNESKSSDLCLKVISLGSHENDDDSSEKFQITLNGSLVIQTMLHFKKPIKIINSLLDMDTDQLVHILCNPRGCHIADAFFSAEFIGEKSKDALVNKLKDKLATLAVDKFGSRAMDQFWAGSSSKGKMVIVESLHQKESQLMTTDFGRGYARNIGLSSYRHNKSNWIKIMVDQRKKKRLFQNILNDSDETIKPPDFDL